MKIDVRRLEQTLKALGYATRLELLLLLRTPHTVDEILVQPGPARSAGRPDRPISKQAVRGHLRQLVAEGLVRARACERPAFKGQNEYFLDDARLFAAAESFRGVAALGSRGLFNPGETMKGPEDQAPVWEPGPKLVLVHGVQEGRAFPLRTTALQPGRGWIIGRNPAVHVGLAYDPYVSQENAEIVRRGAEFWLLDLRSARNGTSHNWQRLPVGGEARLVSGDVVGIGRTLLLFRES